jgi:hypothetical protein
MAAANNKLCFICRLGYRREAMSGTVTPARPRGTIGAKYAKKQAVINNNCQLLSLPFHTPFWASVPNLLLGHYLGISRLILCQVLDNEARNSAEFSFIVRDQRYPHANCVPGNR